MKKAEIKDRIKEAIETREIKQAELVEKTGIDKGQMSSYLSGKYKPKQRNIELIAKALSVDEAWLMGYDVPMEGGAITKESSPEIMGYYKLLNGFGKQEATKRVKELTYLPQYVKKDTEFSAEIIPTKLWAYYGKIACAGTGFVFDDIPTDTIEAPVMDADFVIGVNGESMEPDYHDGEKLYVKKTDYIKRGEVGIFTINNECFLKEYGKDGLVSRNSRYDDIPGSEDVRLIGKVVGKVDEG